MKWQQYYKLCKTHCLTRDLICAVLFSKAETDSSDDSCFEVDMPGETVYQSSGSASGEKMTIDLNDQSSTQNSVSASFDMVQLFCSTFSLCLMYITSFYS